VNKLRGVFLLVFLCFSILLYSFSLEGFRRGLLLHLPSSCGGLGIFTSRVQFALPYALTGYDTFPVFLRLVFSFIPFFSYLTGWNLYHIDTLSCRLSFALVFLLAISSFSQSVGILFFLSLRLTYDFAVCGIALPARGHDEPSLGAAGMN